MKCKWILLGLVGLLAVAGARSAPAATITFVGTWDGVSAFMWNATSLSWLDEEGNLVAFTPGDDIVYGDLATSFTQAYQTGTTTGAPNSITFTADSTNYNFLSALDAPVTKNGTGSVALWQTLTAPVTLNEGTLVLYQGATSSSITLNGGTLAVSWDGSSGSCNTQVGTSSTLITLGGDTTICVGKTNGYRIVPQGFQAQLVGTITGSGKLTKTGSGRLTLIGDNNYTGGTLIKQGMLEVASSTALGTGDLELSGPSAYHGDYVTWSASTTYYDGMVFMWDDYAYQNSYEGSHSYVPENAASNYAVFNLNNQNITVDQLTLTCGNIVDVIHHDKNTGEADPYAMQGYGYLPSSTYLASLLATDPNLYANYVQYGNGTITASAFNVMDGSIYANLAGASAALTKSTDGWVVLQAPTANTYGGGTFVQAGTLTANSAASLPNYGTSGKLSVSSGATFAVGGGTAGWTSSEIDTLLANTSAWEVGSTFGMDTTNGDMSYSGNASGVYGLAKFGDGTAVLSGTNTYTGGTHVVAGTLTASSTASLPGYNVSGKVTVDSGAAVVATNSWTSAQIDALWNNAGGASDGYVGIDTSAGSFTYTCGVTNPTVTGFAKTGDNTLKVLNALPYGALSVAAGTLDISSQNQTISDLTGAGSINIGSTTFTVSGTAGTRFDGAITGTGNVVKTGSGSLWLTHTAPTTGPDTWSGTLTLAQGTLGFASGGLDNCSSIIFTGGVLCWAGDYTYGWYYDDNGFPDDESMWEEVYGVVNSGNTQDMSAKFAPIAAGQAAIIDTSGSVLVASGWFGTSSVMTSGNSVSFATAISGEGGLTKQGDGQLTLTVANSYLGATTVNGGALVLAAAGAASGSTTIVNDGTLYVNATGAVAGSSLVLNGGEAWLQAANGVASNAAITIGAGARLLALVDDALSDTVDVTVNSSGTFSIDTCHTTVNSVTLAGGLITIANPYSWAESWFGYPNPCLGTTKLTCNAGINVQAGTVSVPLDGSAGLTKTGSGTVVVQMPVAYDLMTCDGAPVNTYTGLTTVNGGRLVLKANVASIWYCDVNVGSEVAYGAWNPVLNLGGADVQSGVLSFDYSCTGGTSPAATILADLAASYNSVDGHFASGQIYSSTAAAAGMALGWKDDTTNSVVDVMYTYYGDTNLDGSTDFTDLTNLLSHYNQTSGGYWAIGDFNYDGSVDFTDLTSLLSNYNRALAGAQSTVAVPEPSTLLLSLVGLIGLLVFAWRKTK